jgi:hypothetical protein
LIFQVPNQAPQRNRPRPWKRRSVSLSTAIGALTLVLAFRAGGFFPAATAWTALALCAALVLHVTSAQRPFAGWSATLTVVTGALALLAVWTLLSGEWSGAPARALPEFDRLLVYLLVTALAGATVRRDGDLARIVRATALAIGLICAAGVLTRVLPGLLPAETGFDADRLAFPLTYWNAVGVLAAIGIVLQLALSCAPEQPAWSRVAAAALIPVSATALLLTFSRGGLVAALAGVVLFVALGHPRALLVVLPATALPTAAVVAVVLGADRLTSDEFASAAAAGERSRALLALAVAVVVAGGLRAAALAGEPRLARLRVPGGRRTLAAVALALLVVVAGGAVVADVPARVAEQRRAFAEGDIVPVTADPADRLGQVGNNGRLAQWRVALDGYRAEPLHGTGAGTYRLAWERDRPAGSSPAVDGHSLYLETLGELGLPGLTLVLVALLGLLTALARGIGGPEHLAHASLLAAALALVLHAGIDWDWEMPVLWIWLLAAGGVAAASRTPRAWRPGRVPRIVAGLAVAVVALTPWSVARSEAALGHAVDDLRGGDCTAAASAALESLDALSVRAEPLEVLGYCDIRAGRAELGVSAMRAASSRDPGAWQYAYGLAIAEAVARRDPRPAAAAALRRNPREPLARALERALRRAPRRDWPRVALRAEIPFR